MILTHLKICHLISITLFSILFVGMFACKKDEISHNTSYSLSISRDTLSFDTVFTKIGSSTQTLKLYNRHASAIAVSRVWFASEDNGLKTYFHVNIDGENNLNKMNNIVINAHDSAFLFISVFIDPTDQNSPIVIEDDLYILVNGNITQLHLQAIGQNVIKIASPNRICEYETFVFENTLPYLIYDTMVVSDDIVMKAGAILYMHQGASLQVYGDVTADGSLTNPIKIRGDRLDKFYHTYITKEYRTSYTIPYSYMSGQWNGFCLLCDSNTQKTPQYKLNYVEIIDGTMGLYCDNTHQTYRPHLQLQNCRIHNNAISGVVLNKVDATIYNTEISNSGKYTLYCYGANLRCNHTTAVNYYYKSSSISFPNSNTFTLLPTVCLLSDSITKNELSISITNSIITGYDTNSLHFDTLLRDKIMLKHNYLRCDSFSNINSENNIFAKNKNDTSKVFLHNDVAYLEHYFNFHLDSLSPARGIGDAIQSTDRDGNTRKSPSDAGCYEYIE